MPNVGGPRATERTPTTCALSVFVFILFLFFFWGGHLGKTAGILRNKTTGQPCFFSLLGGILRKKKNTNLESLSPLIYFDKFGEWEGGRHLEAFSPPPPRRSSLRPRRASFWWPWPPKDAEMPPLLVSKAPAIRRGTSKHPEG